MDTREEKSLLPRAGHLLDAHAMLWSRILACPIEQAWQTVSTLEGLRAWWLIPGTATRLDLQVGGRFEHHWTNTVTGFRPHEFIDFSEPDGSYAATGGMRFELKSLDSTATGFIFLDTWAPMTLSSGSGVEAEQVGGRGTPWPGVAAGWHCMVDQLERLFDPAAPQHEYDDVCHFYAGYLRDMFRWRAMVQRR